MSKFIAPREKVFKHLDRLSAWQRGETPAPVTLEWDLSNRCPYGCAECHFAYTHTKGPWTRQDRRVPILHDRGGDLADTSQVSVWLREAAQAGVKAVVWTGGGEPTIHPDFGYIVRQAAGVGLQQGLYSLGATIEPETAVWLRDVLAWVVVSLDAHTPDQYAAEKRTPASNFARACQAIRSMTGGTSVVGVSFLLHEHNYGQAAEMVALARSLGASYTTLRPTIRTHPDQPGVPVGDRAWVAQAMPLLEHLAKEPDVEVDPARFLQWATWQQHPFSTCHGIKLNATITPDGRMWVCPNRREFGDQHSLLGDLRTESFGSIWARHPGHLPVDANCRAMCRLGPLSETLDQVLAPRPHSEFL